MKLFKKDMLYIEKKQSNGPRWVTQHGPIYSIQTHNFVWVVLDHDIQAQPIPHKIRGPKQTSYNFIQDESTRYCIRIGLEVFLYVYMPFGILMYRQLFFLFSFFNFKKNILKTITKQAYRQLFNLIRKAYIYIYMIIFN